MSVKSYAELPEKSCDVHSEKKMQKMQQYHSKYEYALVRKQGQKQPFMQYITFTNKMKPQPYF